MERYQTSSKVDCQICKCFMNTNMGGCHTRKVHGTTIMEWIYNILKGKITKVFEKDSVSTKSSCNGFFRLLLVMLFLITPNCSAGKLFILLISIKCVKLLNLSNFVELG